MSDLDRNYVSPFGRAAGRVDAATVDAGLRSYMLRIYNYMSIGLAITGLAALGVYMAAVTTDQAGAAAKFGNAFLTPFGYAMYVSPLKWLFILAPLVMVFAISAGINRLRPATAQMLFWVFSALMGISLSSIFLVYTHTSIVRVFFITAATFGALSLYGYTTKRDMSGMASFLFMGLIGVIIASLVNLFLASSMLQFIVSVVGVLVFAGLTAWDTQRLKNDYIYGYASAGWRSCGEGGDHRCAVALPELHQPVHAAAAAARTARLSATAKGSRVEAPASRPGLFFCPQQKYSAAPCPLPKSGPPPRPTSPPSPKSTSTRCATARRRSS